MMLLGTGTWPLLGPADLFLGIAPFSQPTGTCNSWDRALQLHYLTVQYLKERGLCPQVVVSASCWKPTIDTGTCAKEDYENNRRNRVTVL